MDLPREEYFVDDDSILADDNAYDKPENGAAKYCPDCEMWLNGPTQWDDHKIGKKHKKNVKKGGPSKTPALSKAKAKQPPEEATGESPEAEEAMTTPAVMEDVNQQYGYPGGGPPPQYGYPGAWAPSQYGYPNLDPGYHYHWNWQNLGYTGYDCCYHVPLPLPYARDQILLQPH